jgi:hypothetical protein
VFVPELCLDEVTPMEEDICNGEDTNCDGVIEKEIEATDILFIVDMSGSMLDDINAVTSALSQFALYYSDSEVLQWGLVLIAVEEFDSATGEFGEKLKIEINLTDFESFMTAFSSLDTTQMEGGDEQSLDAIYLSLQNIIGSEIFDVGSAAWYSGYADISSEPEKENWNINWREDAKRVIITFTDEEPQSYLIPTMTQNNVIAAIEAVPDLSFYVFTSGFGKLWWDDFTTSSAKAKMEELSSSAEEMYGKLLSVLDETACGEN